ncbi:MAG: hypothetical protein ACLGH1_02195 [Gammaproteobacteria bacterium]
MTKAISTTTTKHPHLSVVQLFKEPLQSLQQRGEIMINFHFAVKHREHLFSNRPGSTPEQKTPETRLTSRLPHRPASVETAAAPKSCAL